MKRVSIFAILSLVMLAFRPNHSVASHLMGVDLTYECLDACTIRVHLSAYRDCSGQFSIPNTISFKPQTPGCGQPILVGNVSPQVTTEVTPVCPNAQTQCVNSNSQINGTQQFYWYRDYYICSQPNCIFTISWGTCCRNQAITSGAANDGMGISQTTLNTNITPCNSSPQFSNPPVPYICEGQPYVFNQGATDAEGDSLSYSLGPCFDEFDNQVSYGAGYSPGQPLGPTWDVSINSATGDITVLPNPTGSRVVGVMCVYVEEWRNGALINTIVRDIQMTTIPCANTLPSIDSISNPSTGLTKGYVINTCLGDSLCFDLAAVDPDLGQTMTIFWNQNIPGGTFFETGNPANTDTITGLASQGLSATFCWLPPAAGVYAFQVTVQDDACPIIGQSQFTVQIIVQDVISGITQANPSCGTVTLCATPSTGVPPFTFQWTGSGGLSANPGANDSCVTHSYAATGTYDYQLLTTDSSGCSTVDSGSTTFSINVQANAGPDISICSGGSGTIGAPPLANEVYSWSPTTGLSSPTSANPSITLINAGTTTTVHQYILTTTDTTDGCTSVDTVGVTVYPVPSASFTSSSQTCFGDPITFTYTGHNGTGAAFSWNFAGGTPASASGQGPHSVTWSTPGQKTINLSVTENGCTSPINSQAITILQPLTANTTTTANSCATTADNGTASVFPSGGSGGYTYLWDDPNAQTTQQATGLTPGSYNVTVTDANNCQVTANAIVADIPPPTVSVGPSVTFCEGEGGATVTATASGGNPGYSYQWSCSLTNCGIDSVFDNDPLVNPTSSTWYYVYAVDANGCISEIDSVWVEVLAKPIVDAGQDIILCGDNAPCQNLQPTVANMAGPFTYSWFPSDGLTDSTLVDPCARPDSTTIYTLVVTASNGCKSDFTTVDTNSTVTVHVNPVPVAEAGPDRDICFGDTVQLEGFGSNAGPSYSYQWSPFPVINPSAANPLVNPGITTVYFLTVISNGCPSYTDSVTVEVHAQPTVDPGQNTGTCLGVPVLLDAQAEDGTPGTLFTYDWTPVNVLNDHTLADPTANPDTTTTFTVVATSEWGCESAPANVLVTVLPSPIAEAGDNITHCLGDSLTLQGGYFYTTTPPADPQDVFIVWSPNTNMDDPTIAMPTVDPQVSTVYSMTVSTGPCSTTDSVIVTVIPEIGLNATADTNTACEGSPVQLTATAGIGSADFQWSPMEGLDDHNSATPIATPEQTTTYSVIASESGCMDTMEVTIEIIPTPNPAYLSSATEGCTPHTVNFFDASDDAVNYIWDFGDGSNVSNESQPNHVYAAPGTYYVSLTVSNFGGCTATTDEMEITVIDPPIAEFTSIEAFPAELPLPNTTVQFINQSQGAVSYTWYFGDGTASDLDNPSHTFDSIGEFVVTLIASNSLGCNDQVVHGPYIIFAPDLFIPNVFSPNNDNINDRFLVEYSGSQTFNIQIFDRWGAQHYDSNNKMEGWNGNSMNGKAVPEGGYFYRVRIGDREYTGDVTLVR